MTTAALGMTVDELQRMKERAQPIVMVTAFDFASGRVAASGRAAMRWVRLIRSMARSGSQSEASLGIGSLQYP